MKKTLLILFLLYNGFLFSQKPVQTIRGKVVDKQSESSLPGVILVVKDDSTKRLNASTDVNGKFRIEKVPVGRHTILVKFIGYNDVLLSNIIVDAGKEVVLNIAMEEKVYDLKTAEIVSKKGSEVINEMAVVSASTFSIEETDRYSGSRSDPARMVSNFAGVQGADDSRNDVVIRGNSPMGLLWRIEGVDIPNPNHFAIPGTTGSALSILNNKVFGNSDFFTGAFPAEYGNANSGVFDIRIRNGNNEKHEFTAQLGFLGTEVAAEGPISKKAGSSYLITYRYSTLKIISALNIKIGTDAVPNYQDASFKLNFPLKKGAVLSIFGLGGTSKINMMMSDKSADDVDLYGDNNRDQLFGSSMGVVGISHSKTFNSTCFLRTTLAIYGSRAWSSDNIFYRDTVAPYLVDTLFKKMDYNYDSRKITLNSALTKKFSTRLSLKTGIIAEQLYFNMVDSSLIESTSTWVMLSHYAGESYLLQPFMQWKYKQSDNLVFSLGLHAQYLTLNNNYSIEPRAGIRWDFLKNQTLSLGYGMHSQMQPSYIYFQQKKNSYGDVTMYNKDLDFTHAQHLVLGYEAAVGKSIRIKSEVYYQYLDNIPVDVHPTSFSLVNQGASFSRFFPDSLTNKGTAYNYGLELTLEKTFSNSYYFLITGSLYQSRYKGSDGIERNTDFNGLYAVNLLIGKEFKLGQKMVLLTGAKVTLAGGKYYTPADKAASKLAGELVEIDSLRNTEHTPEYFRFDLKIGIKRNGKRLTHELAIDLLNVFQTKNVLGLIYAPDPKDPNANPLHEEYQLGFLPLFYYKIDF